MRTALQTGSVNHRKSDPRLQPCPKLVVDAHVGKSVQARVCAALAKPILSQCPLSSLEVL